MGAASKLVRSVLPQGVLSTIPIAADFARPRDHVPRERLEDFELGGAGIQNPTQGLRVHVWRGRYIDGSFLLDVPGVLAPVTIYSAAGVTEFGFTFDQNMQPFLCYVVDDGPVFFRWFDATVPGFVVTELPAGSFTPRCTLDDKRALSGTLQGKSDIVLAYMRAGVLYYRQQRDRYEVEYELASDLADYQLDQLGLNLANRLQFRLIARTVTVVE